MPEVNKPAVQKKSENLPEPHKPVIAEGGDTIARLLVEQGVRLFAEWNLPEIYKEVVTVHHDLELDTQNVVVSLVRLANLDCRKLGLGLENSPELVLPTTAEAQFLGVDEISLAEFEIAFEDQFLGGKAAPASRLSIEGKGRLITLLLR